MKKSLYWIFATKKEMHEETEIVLCTEVENREYYRRYFNLS